MIIHSERARSISIFILLTILCTSLAAFSGPKSERLVSAKGCNSVRLKVEGQKIVDGKGQAVTLRGIYCRAVWIRNEQDVLRFKKLGVNFIRILLPFDKNYWQAVNGGTVDIKKRCIIRQEHLAELDKRCQWLEKNKMYYLIDVARKYYGFDNKFEQPNLLAEQLSAMYTKLAMRYKDRDYLIGYAMFSEIYVPEDRYSLYKKLCTTIVDAVHKVDPGRIISATGVATSAPHSMVDEIHIERPDVIYDFHYYWVKTFTHYRTYYGDMRYPGRVPHGTDCSSYYQDRAFHESKLKPVFDFSKKWNVPVWCGETGAFGDAPDGSSKRWLQDVIQIFERHNIPWIIWMWKSTEQEIPDFWSQMWQGEKDYRTTISPHGGSYIDPVSIKLETWAEDAEIRYTTDGSRPGSNSRLYTGPFKITDDITIKASAFGAGLNNAPVDCAEFKFGGIKADNSSHKFVPGLECKYFKSCSREPNDVDLMDVEGTGFCNNFSGPASEENCKEGNSVQFNGFIKIDKAGRYFFYPQAYGAYSIFIGSEMVNWSPGNKAAWARISPGIVTLEAGLQRIKINYSRPEGYGPGFVLRIQRDTEPIMPPSIVDDSMLFHIQPGDS